LDKGVLIVSLKGLIFKPFPYPKLRLIDALLTFIDALP
jgi:hypothetical protein